MRNLVLVCVLIVSAAAVSQEYDYDEEIMHPRFGNRNTKETVTEEGEKDHSYWKKNGEDTLREHISNTVRGRAKNTILFLGDGMGIPTIMAARVLNGQRNKESGENGKLSFEKFPATGIIKTYCIDSQVADSACSATAYLGGAKANIETVGVDGNVKFQSCEDMQNKKYHVKSLAQRAIEKGKSAGIVTTTRVTHASPAAAYAHSSNRRWENDAIMKSQIGDSSCKDIAYQLIHEEPGKSLKVILGGGEKQFRTKADGGWRDEGDLINDWKAHKESLGKPNKFVKTKDELKAAVDSGAEYLFGVFHEEHLEYHMQSSNTSQPTLEEMTEAAIKTLSKDEDGYFLFVEGGRIDHAHHGTYAHMALDETIELAKAVTKALEMTNSKDTLVIVTADHSHVMSVSGYPSRGNNIVGINDEKKDLEGMSTTTLNYANGPGYREPRFVNETHFERDDLAEDEKLLRNDPDFRYPTLYPLDSETHGGEDVPIYAYGPWQHLFTGAYEQSVIPHIVSYAMCIGDDEQLCGGSAINIINNRLLLLVFGFSIIHYLYNEK